MYENVVASHQKTSAEPAVGGSVGAMVPAPTPAPAPVPAPAAAPASVPVPAPTPVPVSASTSAPGPHQNNTPSHPPGPTAAPPPPSTSAPCAHPFPPTKLVIKQGGGGASVSWSSSCPPPATVGTRPESSNQSASLSQSSSTSSSSFNSRVADDDDALPQRTSKPPIKTYEARRRIGLKLKIKQDQMGFSKVVHNTALDPVHTPQPLQSSQAMSQPQFEIATPRPESNRVSSPSTVRTQSPVSTASSASSVTTVTTQCNPAARGNVAHGCASSSATSHSWPMSSTTTTTTSSSSSTTQMNGTLDHDEAGGVKQNSSSSTNLSQKTCRLPLRKTYRENVSPRVRPGVPGGGEESFLYPRTTLSPTRHEASSPPSERTVIASVKVEKRGRDSTHKESSHEMGRLGSAMNKLDEMDEVFGCGMKTTQHHLPQLLSREGAKDRMEEQADQKLDVGKYKQASAKKTHRAGGTFRMDQHAPGPPSPEPSFMRDSLLPAKRCKSDSPDMDNASFSSGSPPDDSLNQHLQCAIDSILNLQQEPTTREHHLKGGSSRSHQHQSQRPGSTAASSHRSSVLPSSASSSLAQHPQVGGRGHNGNLVPQTQSR